MKVIQKLINKAKVSAYFRPWASLVKSSGMAYQIPEDLIDSLDPELDKYVNLTLEKLGLKQVGNGFWERK